MVRGHGGGVPVRMREAGGLESSRVRRPVRDDGRGNGRCPGGRQRRVCDGPLPKPLAEEIALAFRVYDSVRTQLLAHVHGEARRGSHDDGATLNRVSSAFMTSLPALAEAAASHSITQRRQDAPASSYVGSYQRIGSQEIMLGTTDAGIIRVALGNVRHRHKPVPTTSLVVSVATGLLVAAGEHAEAVIDELRGCLDGVDLSTEVVLVHVKDVPVVRDRIVDRIAGDVLVETDDGPDPGSPDDPGGNFVFGSVLGADGNYYSLSLTDWADIELDEVPAPEAGRYVGAVWVAALSKTTVERPPLPPMPRTTVKRPLLRPPVQITNPLLDDHFDERGTRLVYGILETELHCRNLRALAAFCDTFRPGQSAREHLAVLHPLLQPATAELAERFEGAARR